MAGVEIKGLDGVKALLAGLSGELKKVGDQAQNQMAYEIYAAEKDQMRADLDRPTPWSVGSVRYKKVGTRVSSWFGAPKIEGAAVGFEDPFGYQSGLEPERYLGVQIVGGVTAGPKRSELQLQQLGVMPKGTVWVPDRRVAVNAYGNIPGQVFVSIYWDLKQSLPDHRRGKNWAVIGPKGKELGIIAKVGGEWVPYLWFVPRAKYSKRYDFYGRAEREAASRMPSILSDKLDAAVERMKAV